MHRARRAAFAVVTVTAVLTWAVGCSDDSSTSSSTRNQLRAGSTNTISDSGGRFALPAPRLAKQVSVQPRDSGTATARFSVAYEVANTRTADRVAADRAEILFRIAPSMFRTGPQPNDQVFTKTLTDDDLDRTQMTRSYEVEIPADAWRFLESKGLDAADPATRSQALALINVSVQQYRDLQLVDGKYDWIYGTTFNAAQSPTKTSDNPGGALTVRNDTGTGVYGYDWSDREPVPQLYGSGLQPIPDQYEQVSSQSTGVSIALAGAAVSCFYQGNDGSNPEGFNVNLAPGVAVTQAIVADDSSVNLPNDNTAAAATADAIEETLKVGVTALDTAASIAFGGPFTLIIALATNFLNFGEYCNNQPNIMQLGAVVENGQGSSNTNWAVWDGCTGTCGGWSNYYTSPWESSAPDSDAEVVNNAVQLAPDTEHTYNGQPLWLAQVPIQGCGIGNASNSNTSGCTSQNVISLRWTTEPACPFTNGYQEYNGSVVGGVSWCYQPAPASPEVSACGTNNAQCVSYDPSS